MRSAKFLTRKKRGVRLKTDRSLRVVKLLLFRLKRSKWLSALVILIFLLFALAFVYIHSDVFFLRKIVVTGNLGTFVTSDDIKVAISDELAQSTIRLNTGELQDMLLNKYETIKQISLTKKFPDTLLVNVVEKSPAIAIKQGESVYVFDAFGNYITKLNAPVKLTIPVAKILEKKNEEPVDINSYFSSAPILLQIVRLDWDILGLRLKSINLDELSVYLDVVPTSPESNFNVQILLSRNLDVTEQYQRLSVLLKSKKVNLEKTSQIDLRFERIVVRPKQAAK